MFIKKVFIIIILISAGLLPADIFLYAQNKDITKQLKIAEDLIFKKEIDSSFLILNTILKDSSKLKTNNKADLFYFLTKYYAYKNKEEIELFYNLKAKQLYKKLDKKDRISDLLYAKFEIFVFQSNLSGSKKAKIYLDEFYKIAIQENNSKNIIKSYKGYAKLELDNKNFIEAINYYDKIISETEKSNDVLTKANITNNKGLIYSFDFKLQDSARMYYNKALKLFISINNNNAVFTSYVNIGLSFVNENDLNTALSWLKKADSIPLKEFKNKNKMKLYGQMANIYEYKQDYKNALDYAWLYNDYKDSVDIKAQNIAISDINIQYESAEKEKKNIQLTEANKRKKLYIIGVFSYLAYRNIKRKNEIVEKNIAIQKQKVVTLVKDQELMSMDAMLEGQEIERKKIAEDLHDNLGSTLATLKLHFDNYRSNFSKTIKKKSVC